MDLQFLLTLLAFCALPVVLIIHRIRQRRGRGLLTDEAEEVVPDGMVKIEINRYEIWLRHVEVDNFNAQPRKTRMALAKEFDKRVKKGQLVPIIETGVIMGFVTPKEKARHG